MKRRFRIALALRSDVIPGCDALFLGAHQYARGRSSWQILWQNQTSQLTWKEAVECRPDGILGVLNPGHKIAKSSVGPAKVVIMNNVASPFHEVLTDGKDAGRRAAAHFLEQRLEHFAFVGPMDADYSMLRLEGFREKLPPRESDSLRVYDTARGFPKNQSFRKWLKSLSHPCGVLCAWDLIALHTVSTCLAEGIAVPNDLAILGISNNERLCYESPVVLSSVAQHLDTVGYQAAELMDRLLQGEKAPRAPILVPAGEVVVRDSTRSFGGRDPLVRRALMIIHREHHSPLTMPDLLRELGNVSQRLLSIRFQKAVSISPYQEILRSRISRAQRRLRTTRLSLEEIAEESGFYDCAQFCRHFRKFSGQTPAQYRKEHEAHLPHYRY